MARVKDAGEAEEVVRSHYRHSIVDPQPYDFRTNKRGHTWIVKFSLLTVMSNEEEHEWHIKDNGEVVSRK